MRRALPFSIVWTLFAALLLAAPFAGSAQDKPPAVDPPAASPANDKAALPPLDLNSGYRIPFQYDTLKLPIIIVQARINGGEWAPFMVDTGCSFPLVMDTAALADLKLKTNKQKGTANRILTVQGVEAKTLDLMGDPQTGGMHYDLGAGAVVAMDLKKTYGAYVGPHVAGIIGIPVLAPSTVRLDFAAKRMTIYPAPHAPLELPEGVNIALIKKEDDTRYLVETVTEDKTTARLLVDTGSQFTALPLRLRPHVRPLAVVTGGFEQLDRISVSNRLLLPQLQIGALREPGVGVDIEPTEGEGILGMNIMQRYVILFDFRNNRMTLQRAPDYQERRRQEGWSGIKLDKQGKTVAAVAPGSPGAKAGVSPQDTLVKVGNETPEELGGHVTQNVVDGVAGTPVVLMLRRGKEDKRVAFESVSEFEKPARLLTGVMLNKLNKAPFDVIDVMPGCLAEKAGLKAGDRIIAMNGARAANISSEVLSDWMYKPQMILSVLSAGETDEKQARKMILTLPAPSTRMDSGGKH